MPRFKTLLALLAALALLVAACGNDDEDAGTEQSTSDDTTAETEPEPGSDDTTPAPDPGEQPPEGAAATIGSSEITVDTVEGIFDEVSEAPAVASQLEGEEGEMFESVLRAQILGQLIAQEIVLQRAEADFGLVLTAADLDETYDQFATEMGGEDEFQAQLEASGLSEELFETLELPLVAMLIKLEEEFGVEEPASPDGEPSQAQAELQEWAFDQFAVTEVRVAQEYGSWNPQTAQVEPAGMPQMSAVPDGAELVPEG